MTVLEFRRPAIVDQAFAFYNRHERLAPALFFFGGVAWDAATLKRVDSLVDNLILLAYLFATGVMIVLVQLVESGKTQNPFLIRYREMLTAGIQFFMGALFSANVVYFSQSASFTDSSAFLIVLVLLLVGNEFIKKRLVHLYLALGLYYLAAFSYSLFFVPVLTRHMGYLTFLLGGVVSLGLVLVPLSYLRSRGVVANKRQFAQVLAVVVLIFASINGLYLLNWIPPVPLAMRHGGIYHDVRRVPDGFRLTYEPASPLMFWKDADDVFQYQPGEPVYCFTAVFAPHGLNTPLYHVWSRYDESQRAWVQTDRMTFSVLGERYRGYRYFTRKRNFSPGRWRVDVQTPDGKTLGRVRFQVHATDTPPVLSTRIYD